MHFQLFNQSSHPLIMSTWESPTEIYITLDGIPWSSVWVTKSARRHEGVILTTGNDVLGKMFGFVTDLCD